MQPFQVQYCTVAILYFLLIREEFADAILLRTVCHQKSVYSKALLKQSLSTVPCTKTIQEQWRVVCKFCFTVLLIYIMEDFV